MLYIYYYLNFIQKLYYENIMKIFLIQFVRTKPFGLIK